MTIDDEIMTNKGLVHYTINRFFPDEVNDEDIAQIGLIALWRAIENKPSEKAFSSYAVNTIKNAILNELKKRQMVKRNDSQFAFIRLDDENESEKVGYDEIPYKLIEIEEYREKQEGLKREILELITEGYNLNEISEKTGNSYSKIYRLWNEIKSDIKIS